MRGLYFAMLLSLGMGLHQEQAFSFPISHDDVIKHMKEADVAPQDVGTVFYYPLDKVISKKEQMQVKAERARKAKQVKAFNMYEFFKDDQGVDLTQYDSPVLNQKNGRCTAYGFTGASANLLNRKEEKIELSPDYLWSFYKKPYMHLALDALQSNKQLEMQYWPHSYNKPKFKDVKSLARGSLSKVRYIGSDPYTAIKYLRQGYPIALASSVSVDLAACRGVVRTSPLVGNTSGGHATTLSGYGVSLDFPDSGGAYFKGKNSWGKRCHKEGYFALPVSYCNRPDSYCRFYAVMEGELLEVKGELK